MSVVIARGLTMRPAATTGLSERMKRQYILDNVRLLLDALPVAVSASLILRAMHLLGPKLNNSSCEQCKNERES
jgi:hypothetical protein